MSDTPRTDAVIYGREIEGYGRVEWVRVDFARQLERELAAANKERDDALMMLGVYKMKSEEAKDALESMTKDRDSWQQQSEMHATDCAKVICDRQRMEEKIKRLVEAGDAMFKSLKIGEDSEFIYWVVADHDATESWTAAKEGKS